jgi:hypothetical protein
MNTPNTKPNLKKSLIMKVTLSSESLEKINEWTQQIIGDQRGVNIKPSEVVNWLISQHHSSFTPSEIDQYREKNIDQVEVAQWALKEIKAALRRGEKINLRDLVLGEAEIPLPPGWNAKPNE